MSLSDQEQARRKQEAAEHLARAGKQGRHATRNVARAAQTGATVIVDEAKDGLTHAAHDVADGVEYVADEVKTHAPRISARGVSVLTGDLGVGFLATSVSIYSGVVAVHAFKRAIAARGTVTR